MNVGMMRVAGHYYQSTKQSLRSAYVRDTNLVLGFSDNK